MLYEVITGNMAGMRRVATCTVRQIPVSNHQIGRLVQVVDSQVRHLDRQTGILHFLTQHAGAHGTGAHAGVTSHNDSLDGAHVSRNCTILPLGAGFHLLHLACGIIQIVAMVLRRLVSADKDGRDDEGSYNFV